MTSRFRFPLPSTVGLIALTVSLIVAGCGEPGKLSYIDSPDLLEKLGDKPEMTPAALKKAEELRGEIHSQLVEQFGSDPQHIKVPAGVGLPGGGIYLASHLEVDGKARPIKGVNADGLVTPQEGGYGLYRKHCLHCHGVSGAGDGPTAAFLYPRPRDYRRGLYKFTSTVSLHRPARADLRKTIKNGLHGTSMPAFEALMNDAEIEQVLDYVVFLSLRGEVERGLIDAAASDGELSKDAVIDTFSVIFRNWKNAENEVENPPIPRTSPTRESVIRGRNLFLGVNQTGNKVECTTCHGPQGRGDGPSFVDQEIFNNVVFGGDPSRQGERLKEEADRVASEAKARAKSNDPKVGQAAADKLLDAWKKGSLDDWGNPLRPANLNRGIYKGGRRPIDLYWRIAKGINGAKMPAHFPTLQPPQIWDLVNFVLALPYDPGLLDGPDVPAPIVPSLAAPPPAVAQH